MFSIDDEWTQDTSNINQQVASDTTTIPEIITCERKESDTGMEIY